ncbi:unnamed protein product [Gongylonema pulchrum]|uniref:Rho-GAP domain-containing protein n=1 Tax=Gongylonema pulchrum TaxID=637853 RepID=A0A183DRY2_9BILA|nr:unnamed protein product [Gongylonema pulchrum]
MGSSSGIAYAGFVEPDRDNFEKELGYSADDPFAEDFSDISQHEIVNIIADGDWVGRPIIVIYAYRLPSNKTFNHAKFLRFLQFTLDKVVELDYTIVYFHYGLRSNNKPPLKWLLQAYTILDRNILSHNPDCDIPPVVTDLIAFLRENSLNVAGLFRRSAEVNSIKRLQERINMGERIDFLNDEPYKDNLQQASIDASVLLKTFLRSLGEPVTTNALYPNLAALSGMIFAVFAC